MKLNCSKHKIQKIGHKIRNGEPLSENDEIAFTEFRTGHGEILQNFRVRLNNAYIKKRKDVVLVGRLKKRDTIINKIKDRHSKMDLTRMHDIAGLRLFFNDVTSLKKFRKHFLEADKSVKYRRTNEIDKYDYIAKPNKMGYRGIHDVYEEITEDPIKMKLELQYRTWVQHSWATTLEIWDSAYGKKMKFGTETDENIVMFFRYVSELFARLLEKESFMLNLSDNELFKQLIKLDKKTKAIKKLGQIKLVNVPKKKIMFREDSYIVLQKILENANSEASLQMNFTNSDKIDKVFKIYSNLELADKKYLSDIVMVTVKKPKIYLQKAYNNYFNDLETFFKNYDKAILLLKQKIGNRYIWLSLLFNREYLKYAKQANDT